MRKTLIFTVVVVAVVGMMLVLSMDEEPPDDTHLVLDEGPMPTEGNGFFILLESLEAMEWPEDDERILSMPRPEAARDPEIRGLLDRNRNTFALMVRAATAPTFRAPPSSGDETPTFIAATRNLGRLVAIDATVKLARRDENGAFERHLQYLKLVRRFRETGEMLHYLVGSGYQTSALGDLLRTAADVDGGGLVSVADRLEAYGWDKDAMVNALRREYMFMTSLVDEPFQRAGGWQDVPLFGRYIYQSNRTRKLYLDTFDAAIAGLNEDCSTAPRETEPVEMPKWRYLGPNSAGRILHGISVPNLAGFTFSRCREEMNLGLTRLVLAVRAYRADFGALPDELSILVPRYLSELPLDVDGQPFRYSAEEEYLYSVGEDRLDYGGGEPAVRIDWSAPDPGVSLTR